MASGDSLLLQALSKKKGDYLAENPYYRAGAQLSQQPVAAPQSNLQALLLPLLQGASTGLLTGYGKQQANQSEIADKNALFNSISGRDFSPEEALSGETATLSLLNALQEKQDRQSLAAIEAANKAKLANTLAGKFMGITPDGGIGLLSGAPEALQKKAEIEAKAKNQFKTGNATYTPEQIGDIATKLDLTPSEVSSIKGPKDVDRIVKLKTFAGEKTRPPNAVESAYFQNADSILGEIKELKKLAEKFSDSVGSGFQRSIKAGRILQVPFTDVAPLADTNSDEYKFYAKLAVLNKKYASTLEPGKLTDFDVRVTAPLVQGLPEIDTGKAIRDRLDSLEKEAKSLKLSRITNLKKSKVNVSGYKKDALLALGSTFPPTPEGRAAFKAKAVEMGLD